MQLIWGAEYLKGRSCPEEERRNSALGSPSLELNEPPAVVWNSVKPGKEWSEWCKLSNLLKKPAEFTQGREILEFQSAGVEGPC